MSDLYLVGYDATESADRAVAFAAARAKSAGGQVHLVHVLEWSPYSFLTPQELAERRKRRDEELTRAKAILQPAAERLEKDGVDVTYEARHGHAGDILTQLAKEKDAVQIVIGRTGDSEFTARLLGGLAITLAQAAPVPVTIVP